MIKYLNLFSTGSVSHTVGGLWTVQKPSTMHIIDGESMLIENASFLFLKSFNVKIEATNLPITKNLPNDDAHGGRVSELSTALLPSYLVF